MTSWKRITFVVFVLIGGTMTFSYWFFSQFNATLSNLENDLETTLTANTLLVSSSLSKKTELTPIPPEATGELPMPTNLELSFNFPQKGDEIFIGCTYPVSWKSSTTVNLLGTVLVDAGTSESMGPKTSGLLKENTIEKDSQNIDWKVGFVWPGAYYIKVLKINNTDTKISSKVFTINKMPKGIDTAERKKICKESGGSF